MVLWVCVIKPLQVLSLKLNFSEGIYHTRYDKDMGESPRDSYQALRAKLKRHCSPGEGWTGCLTWAIIKIMSHFFFFVEVSDKIELCTLYYQRLHFNDLKSGANFDFHSLNKLQNDCSKQVIVPSNLHVYAQYDNSQET